FGGLVMHGYDLLGPELLHDPGSLLLLPVGGYFTIDAQEASRIVQQLRPKKVIPMHYKTPKCNFPIAGVEEFLKGKERVRKVGSSSISFGPEDFEVSGTEIVVLEPAL
ncbi:MAG: hypothetical protein DRG31_03970, partial [Deltaproteobacteria bacterium]